MSEKHVNGAKMREALVKVNGALDNIMDYDVDGVLHRCVSIIKQVLAAPPRNCDRFNTLEDALAGWREVSPDESGPFDNWLFAEAKGDAE